VFAAEPGEEALALAKRQVFELAVCDIMMPRDGRRRSPEEAARIAPFGSQTLGERPGFVPDNNPEGFSARFSRMAGYVRYLKQLPRLFEFNDLPKLPAIMRQFITFSAGKTFKEARAADRIGDVLATLIRESGAESILELAAGAAIPSIEISNKLHDLGLAIPYRINDKYPDFQFFHRAAKATDGRIQPINEPIDALDIPGELKGLRLLVTSFHHFRPDQAARILRHAYQHDPVAIIELTERRPLLTIAMLPLGFLVMIFRLPDLAKISSWGTALFWVVPAAFAFAWDGFVSCLRSYTLKELELMTRPLSDGYHWRMGVVPTDTPGMRVTYLIGSA
jgi:CheY-like chemotaxis protein